MGDSLVIRVYPDDETDAAEIDQLIQETLADQGVRGTVVVSWVLPELLGAFGIRRLPAVEVDDQVVLQGRVPTREDVVAWFDRLVPKAARGPRRDPARSGWPSSLDEAVAWLVEGMREKDIDEVASANDDDLLLANGFEWGQAIRNGYGLWAGNEPLLRACGTADAEEASFIIIRAVGDRLRHKSGRAVLAVSVFGTTMEEARSVAAAIQEVFDHSGVTGFACPGTVVADVLMKHGISALPAVTSDDGRVLWQGSTPTRETVEQWILAYRS